jgi:hypothetical protein
VPLYIGRQEGRFSVDRGCLRQGMSVAMVM